MLYHFDKDSEKKVKDGKVPIYQGNPEVWNPLDSSFS